MLMLLLILIIILLLLCVIRRKIINTKPIPDDIIKHDIVVLMDNIFTQHNIEYIVLSKSLLEMLLDKRKCIQVVIKNEEKDKMLKILKKYTSIIDYTNIDDKKCEIQMKGDEFIYIINTHSSLVKENNKVNIATDEYIDNLYKITKLMNYFLTKHNISYWLIGGSLIGALRNTPGGPIKWDDDVDVAIVKQDKRKLLNMMKYDKEFNDKIEYSYHNFGYQYRLKNDKNGIKKYYYDVFIYEKKNGIHGVKWYTEDYPNSYYNDLDEIFPLKECDFWDMKLPCPNDLSTVHRGYEDMCTDVLRYALKYNHKRVKYELIDLWDDVNKGETVPMLSKKLASKLVFKDV